MEPPQVPSAEERRKKLWCIDTVEYYSAIKKDEKMALAGKWVELGTLMLSDISQSPKPKAEGSL